MLRFSVTIILNYKYGQCGEGRFEMKRIISATLVLLFAFSSSAYAHTGLTGSSPADGETITEDLFEIELEFNTKVESTSTVKVFTEHNEEISGAAQVNDNVMTSGFMEPLENGTYTVEWKIIGADGHPIQGTYSFTVSQEEVQEPQASMDNEEIIVSPKEELKEDPVQREEVPSKIASNDVLVIILVILFTLAGGFIGWLIGRGRK